MVREIITLNIGGCGIQLGHSVFERYCNEYNIQPNEKLEEKTNSQAIHRFFHEDSSGRFSGRTYFCDLDCNPFETDYTKAENPCDIMPTFNNSVFGKDEGYNDFSRGYNSEIMASYDSPFQNMIRRAIDNCDNFQGFMVNHSITGSGAGLTAKILERMRTDYRRKSVMGFEVCPVPTANKDCNVLDPYNTALSMHNLLELTDVSFMFDNKALHNIVRNNLNVCQPTYANLNEIISKCITAITYPLRAEDCYKLQDLNEYQSHYVPFPRLHFLTPSVNSLRPKYTPFSLIDGYIRESYSNSYQIYNDIRHLLYHSYCINEYKLCNQTLDSVTDSVLCPNNFLMDFAGFDASEDLYMSCFIDYEINDGNKQGIRDRDARDASNKRKGQQMKFVEWVPNGLDCLLYECENKIENKNDLILKEDISCVMVGNNTYFGKWCNNRIVKPFDSLYDRRAYSHHFDESELCETREDIHFLLRDFTDVLEEEQSSEDYEYEEIDYILSEMTEEQMIAEAIKNSLN